MLGKPVRPKAQEGIGAGSDVPRKQQLHLTSVHHAPFLDPGSSTLATSWKSRLSRNLHPSTSNFPTRFFQLAVYLNFSHTNLLRIKAVREGCTKKVEKCGALPNEGGWVSKDKRKPKPFALPEKGGVYPCHNLLALFFTKLKSLKLIHFYTKLMICVCFLSSLSSKLP